VTRVHQMTATLVAGDAISNHIFEIDRRLRAWGLTTAIYAENIEPRLASRCQPDRDYEPFLNQADDLLIYHYSIYSANLELYRRSRHRKIVIYHNITPPEYFAGFDPKLEALCRLGRAALPRLAGCDLALADSEFNRRELIAAAAIAEGRSDVLPIFLNIENLAAAERNVSLGEHLTADGWTNLLYVGRIAPNKRCEDLIKLLYAYRRHVNPRARLWLVGDTSVTAYVRFLRSLIDQLGLGEAVVLTGRVSAGDLRTYYEAATVFVYASQHEGFGVPLVESMYFGVPVLAYHAAAVPETLGDSGVLFKQWRYPEIVEVLHILATDECVRAQVIAGQRRRLADLRPERVEARLRAALERVGVP
jgi:glycosyltransferase involved in cell wall biosynthesis